MNENSPQSHLLPVIHGMHGEQVGTIKSVMWYVPTLRHSFSGFVHHVECSVNRSTKY